MAEIVVTRQTIAAAIAAKRAKQARMPAHWTQRREELSVELDQLIAQWFEQEE